MTDAKFAPETASGLSQASALVDEADNTGEGLYAVFATPADWTSECLIRIVRLGELRANWNSYGANPVDSASIASAIGLVRTLAEDSRIDCPRVAASPAGYVALSWVWDQDARELDLEILPDGTLRYAYLDEHNPSSNAEGETSDPNQIVYLLKKW